MRLTVKFKLLLELTKKLQVGTSLLVMFLVVELFLVLDGAKRAGDDLELAAVFMQFTYQFVPFRLSVVEKPASISEFLANFAAEFAVKFLNIVRLFEVNFKSRPDVVKVVLFPIVPINLSNF